MTDRLETATAVLRVARATGDAEPVFQDYEVPYEPGASVLDGLRWIRESVDPSLAIRFSCISANVCKECTMRVDGDVEYACMARLRPGTIVLEPLPNKPVIRDLVVDTLSPKERLPAG